MAKAKATINDVKPRTNSVDLKSLHIRSFDEDNKYPQRTIDISNDSGTTKSCLKVQKRFVCGSGFTNENLGSIIVNRKGLNTIQLKDKIAAAIGLHQGAAIHFNYNGLGEKTEISFIPFEYNRQTLDESKDYSNRICIYDDWGHTKHAKLDKNKIKYIHKYNRSKVLEQVQAIEIKEFEDDLDKLKKQFEIYQGQVYYWTENGPDEYPLSTFDAVAEDAITEAQTKVFKTRSATTNFMPSHIVVTGVEETDEEGNPKENGMGSQFETFQGSREAAKLIHIQKDNTEEPFELIPVEIQKYDGLLQHTEDSATEDIVRQFMIPPILVLQHEGGIGGSGTELHQAREFYNDLTQHDRDIVSAILKECFVGFVGNQGIEDFSIKPLQYKRPIEADSFKYYTANEIRISQGNPETESDEGDKEVLAVTLGVGGTQSLTAIINDTLLSSEQKKGTISVLFGLSEEDINKMLGL